MTRERDFRYQPNQDAISFGTWQTSFENEPIELKSIKYTVDGSLDIQIYAFDTSLLYNVTFDCVLAFRVLDEHGLLELWKRTKELGGRPARTTFRVKNHLWTKESPITFLRTDGWSFVVASDSACIEIVSEAEPAITFGTEN